MWQIGWSVSLSWNGHILATGGPQDDFGIGATWIFVYDAITTRYNQLGNKLVGTGGIGTSQQGKHLKYRKLYGRYGTRSHKSMNALNY